jgi:hypothetical protein
LLRLRESNRYQNEADMAEIYEYAPIFTEQQVVILGYGDSLLNPLIECRYVTIRDSVGEIARRSRAGRDRLFRHSCTFEPLKNGS